MKEMNSLKMADEAGLEKASSTQYLTWGWHEKALFTENATRDWYRKSSFNSKY